MSVRVSDIGVPHVCTLPWTASARVVAGRVRVPYI